MAQTVADDVVVDVIAETVNSVNTRLGPAATMEFFDGSIPTDCEAADAGTLLATLALPNPVFTSPSGNVWQTNSITPGSVSVTGTAQYFRMKHSGGQCIVQGTITDVVGTATLVFNSVSWTAAQTLAVDFIIFTEQITMTP